MPVQESLATALVRFTGLGIICFNDKNQQGEIAAIRDLNHSLTIKVQEPVFVEGSDHDILGYRDIAVYEKLPKEDVRIEISSAGDSAVPGYEIYKTDGPFNRLTADDFQDFRWIVNMNALHGVGIVQPTEKQRHPLTKIYIRNGLFYTRKLDTNLLFEKVHVGANGSGPGPELFGNVAETIGVKIEGAEVSFRIHIGAREETHILKRIENLPLRIEIMNMDPSQDAVFSDMPDYYQYLAPTSGAQFDLKPITEKNEAESVHAGSVNMREFCHPIGADDLTSVDQL